LLIISISAIKFLISEKLFTWEWTKHRNNRFINSYLSAFKHRFNTDIVLPTNLHFNNYNLTNRLLTAKYPQLLLPELGISHAKINYDIFQKSSKYLNQ